MGLHIFFAFSSLKYIITSLAIISAIFVISTKNAIISVFNLIVLYILVAFYLIYIGITYLGISYIVVYIGAIAILFLFVIMMIDIEVIDKRNNNYIPLLFLLFGGFLLTLKNILYNLSNLKLKSLLYKGNDKYFVNFDKEILFNSMPYMSNDTNIKVFDIIYDQKYNIDFSKDFLNNYDITFSNYNIINKEDYYSSINNISLLPKNDYNEINTILKDFYINSELDNNYLLITPDWDSTVSRITQISAIGDVLYTIYHSFIYIVSIILLLGMVGAIILTADHNYQSRIITIIRNKNNNKTSNLIAPFFIIKDLFLNLNIIYIRNNNTKKEKKNKIMFLFNKIIFSLKKMKHNLHKLSIIGIYPFSDILNNEDKHYEGILGNLTYYVISNIFIGVLLLLINSSFSISVKYLDKGGGFECGFTSFLQTRERYNIIFYRVSLLFLIFDLEIILAFPYPAIYQKNQNNSKNNVLAFLYILVIGFIYELKEGALNIVKTAHSTEIKVDY